MIKKLKAAWDALQKGKALADPALWKARQVTVTALTILIGSALTAASLFGIDVQATDEQIATGAAAIIAVVNMYFTFATTDKVGPSVSTLLKGQSE